MNLDGFPNTRGARRKPIHMIHAPLPYPLNSCSGLTIPDTEMWQPGVAIEIAPCDFARRRALLKPARTTLHAPSHAGVDVVAPPMPESAPSTYCDSHPLA